MAAGAALLVLAVWISFFARMKGVTEGIRGRIEARVQELSSVERQLTQEELAVAAVEGKIGKLTKLEANRGAWRAMLGEISGALADGMWLTRVTPVAVLPGTEAPAAPVPSGSVAGIEIEGMGYLDKIKTSDVIGQYRDKLRESALFSDKTEIVWQPPARSDASTLEFKILAVLEAPQEL